MKYNTHSNLHSITNSNSNLYLNSIAYSKFKFNNTHSTLKSDIIFKFKQKNLLPTKVSS